MKYKYVLYFIIIIFLAINILLLSKLHQEKNNFIESNIKIKTFEEKILNTTYINQLLKNNILTTIKNFDFN